MTIALGYLGVAREDASIDLGNIPGPPLMNQFGAQIGEIVNHLRTRQLIERARQDGHHVDVNLDALPGSNVDSLRWRKTDFFNGPPTSLSDSDLRNPERAPWRVADTEGQIIAEEALGFIIEDASGTDAAHVRRGSSQIYGGGARFGATSFADRVIQLSILAIGRTDRGADYLVAWLQRVLASLNDTGRTIDHLVYRRFNPDPIQIGRYENISDWAIDGYSMIGPVFLVQGIQVSPVTSTARRVTVTLGSSLPASIELHPDDFYADYGTTTSLGAGTSSSALSLCNSHSGSLRRIWEFPGSSDLGLDGSSRSALPYRIAPIINIYSPPQTSAGRPRFVLQEYQLRAMVKSGLSPNPCNDLTISAMRIRGLPSGCNLRIDYANRQALVLDPYYDVPSATWLAASSGAAVNRSRRNVFARPGGAFLDSFGTVFSIQQDNGSAITEELGAMGGWSLDGSPHNMPAWPDYMMLVPYYVGRGPDFNQSSTSITTSLRFVKAYGAE